MVKYQPGFGYIVMVALKNKYYFLLFFLFIYSLEKVISGTNSLGYVATLPNELLGKWSFAHSATETCVTTPPSPRTQRAIILIKLSTTRKFWRQSRHATCPQS